MSNLSVPSAATRALRALIANPSACAATAVTLEARAESASTAASHLLERALGDVDAMAHVPFVDQSRLVGSLIFRAEESARRASSARGVLMAAGELSPSEESCRASLVALLDQSVARATQTAAHARLQGQQAFAVRTARDSIAATTTSAHALLATLEKQALDLEDVAGLLEVVADFPNDISAPRVDVGTLTDDVTLGLAFLREAFETAEPQLGAARTIIEHALPAARFEAPPSPIEPAFAHTSDVVQQSMAKASAVLRDVEEKLFSAFFDAGSPAHMDPT
jgi:hypothetical protein